MSSSNGGCPGGAPVGVKKVASVPKWTSTAPWHRQAKRSAPFCVSLTKVCSHGAPARRVRSLASDPHCIPRALVAKQERTIDLLDIDPAILVRFEGLSVLHASRPLPGRQTGDWLQISLASQSSCVGVQRAGTDREQTFRPNRTARLKAGTGWPRAAASRSNLCPET